MPRSTAPDPSSLAALARRLVALLAVVACTSCASLEDQSVDLYRRGDFPGAYVSIDAERVEKPWQDALFTSLCASIALRAGDFDTARRDFDRAHRVMEGTEGPLPAKVRRLVERDASSLYRGSTHERVMNALYRSLLQLRDGDSAGALLALDGAESILTSAHEEELTGIRRVAAILRALVYTQTGLSDEASTALNAYVDLEPEQLEAALAELATSNAIVWIERGIATRPREATTEELDSVSIDWKRGEEVKIPLLIHVPKEAADYATGEASKSDNSFLRVIEGSLEIFSTVGRGRQHDTNWFLLPESVHLWVGTLEPGEGEFVVHFSGEATESSPTQSLTIEAGKLNVLYLRGDE